MTNTGLIVLGNSGSGKSFIVNVILKKNQYAHETSPSSVTSTTEYQDDGRFFIFNIPGLVESEQSKIDRNKREIETAFQTCPNSRILFIFAGGVGGRIQDQDVVAFKALAKAYGFNLRSVIFIINRLQKEDITNAYCVAAMDMLRRLLELPSSVSPKQFVFLPDVPANERTNYQSVYHQEIVTEIALAICATEPAVHVKKQEVQLQADQIRALENEAKQQQEQFKVMQQQNQEQLKQMENQYAQLRSDYEKVKNKKSKGFFGKIGDLIDDIFN